MNLPVIAIDTREQRPYAFPKATVKTLPTGDYSIEGLEHLVAIERKTSADAYASLGRGRQRFHAEVERLARLDYAAIVIESGFSEFLQPPMFSHMNPRAAINTLLAWSVRYGVHVFFAGDREHGNALMRTLLEMYVRYRDRDAVEGCRNEERVLKESD
jgi:ERCC4-type nuclease